MKIKDLWDRFKRYFNNTYVMPKECKSNLAATNEKRLLIVEPILAAFGLFMFFLSLYNYRDSMAQHIFKFIYYAGFFLLGLFIIFFTLYTSRRPQLNLKLKMLPLHLAIISIYFLIIVTFISHYEIFNSFVIFACISVITPIIFNIEPIIFITVIVATSGIMMQTSLLITHSSTIIINISVFSLITILLSLFKWKTIKADYLHSKQQDEYKDKMEKELELASTVQSSFFNQSKTSFDGWSIEFYSKAMTGVSGDFIDIYSNNEQLEGLGIFDVSGHGIASGLVTMLVKNIIDQEFHNGSKDELKTVIDRINVRFTKEKGNIENYLTGILCRVNDNKINFVNAGHSMPILLKAKDGIADFINLKNNEKTFGAIGMQNIPSNFISHTVELDSGDEFILFTDGVTDETNMNNETFGKERFLKSINRNAERSLTTQIKCIVSDIQNFSAEVPQSDDITILILKKK